MSRAKFKFGEKHRQDIGDRIWGLFAERGYKEHIELVKEYGMGEMMVSRYLNGKTINSAFLKHLHDRFGVCISWLLTGKGDKYDRPGQIDPNSLK